MTSLGERLAQIIEDDKRKGIEQQRIEDEKERLRVVEERAKLHSIFQKSFHEAKNAIELGNKPNGVIVEGYYMPFRYHSVASDSAKHPYHDIYQEWAKVAEEQGLTLYLHNEHDGAGMDDWYRVIFWI